MNRYESLKKAHFLNTVTAVMIFLSVIWMFSGFEIGNTEVVLSARSWKMLKYYTVDSNILMGFAALFMAAEQKKVLSGRKSSVSDGIFILKLCGVVGVTLTMLITVFFLAPTMGEYWPSLFTQSNFFMHLVNPLVSIFTFLKYEPADRIEFRHTFTGVLSVVIYAVFYAANGIMHAEGGEVPYRYDWYGFFMFGIKSIFIVRPIVIAVAYVICFVLWYANRRRADRLNAVRIH